LSRRVRIIEKQSAITVSDKRLIWCGLDICEERDSAGSVVNKRFFPEGMKAGSTNFFHTQDHIGSRREITDGTGATLARYDYDAYGRRSKLIGALDLDFGFTGF